MSRQHPTIVPIVGAGSGGQGKREMLPHLAVLFSAAERTIMAVFEFNDERCLEVWKKEVLQVA